MEAVLGAEGLVDAGSELGAGEEQQLGNIPLMEFQRQDEGRQAALIGEIGISAMVQKAGDALHHFSAQLALALRGELYRVQ